MTFLPDVNVWIALAIVQHVNHRKAVSLYESLPEPTLAFCRITQMAFLRLLTNRHVMNSDALAPDEAWRRLDEIHRGIDTIFAAEPELLDET
ncbi:MAG TPA: hypothetical protein VG297_07725 [Bryobacteraceae bacterium]|nr:hypothetical protein [Bryobacteraceae bacterium]